MQSNKHELKTATFEDGTYVVLRTDRTNPRLLEVIATFYKAADARNYVQLQAAPSERPQEEKLQIAKRPAPARRKRVAAAKHGRAAGAAAHQLAEAGPRQPSETKPKKAAAVQVKPAARAKGPNAASELSGRQSAVLKALRSLMDKKNRVEAKVAELAKASAVPLGSLHSILVSLEKKQMIRTERQGSPKFAAIYEVLETSRKSAGALNGVVHSKAAHAEAAR